ncbi:hypothetical protein Rhe02_49900 [Rhizocola hellebori]|uniref:Sigma-54 factor interaction domain-containing protein n=1 Tax=Rhizocola hellebori TaxID=1392758 RepID=A0A8J3QC39_9ACTN|nr:sigma 54-interacting transcriptional regulator [Rhizocola hellebori]GIH06923.1 hypothetical protein Rhe02_49900 [Rhizocola hellebori]
MAGPEISCSIHFAGDRDATLAVAVRSDLLLRGVSAEIVHRPGNGRATVDDPDRPRLCVSAAPDSALLEFVAGLSEGGRRMLVVVGESGCAEGLTWRLLASGAEDVVAWASADNPGASVLARLQRWREVDGLVRSNVVRRQLVGATTGWLRALRRVVEVAHFTGAALLVTGETGTGKELIARLFHHLDNRPDKSDLIVVDCGAIVPTLAGSEFFGHERGAFTGAMTARDGAFAAANKGTLFLDEVGELPLPLQAELLRVVQESTFKRVGGDTWRKVSFRLVCATNRDLRAEVSAGRFRLDLYHRLAATMVHLPPLRERRADILMLFRHFLAEATGVEGLRLDPAVARMLDQREYPGNVRDLRQLALRIAARHVGPGPVTPGDIPDEERPLEVSAAQEQQVQVLLDDAVEAALSAGCGYRHIRDSAAETAIRLALRRCGDDLQEAARRLGVTDRMLQKWRAQGRALLQ